MYLSKNELDKVYEQEDALKGNIARMCVTDDPKELELNYKFARDRIENIYRVTRDHLETDALLALHGKKEGSDNL